MVGGSSSNPELQHRLSDYFGKSVQEIFAAVFNPDNAVAVGAAIMGASLQGSIVRSSPPSPPAPFRMCARAHTQASEAPS